MEVSQNSGVPQNRWCIVENMINMDGTPILRNLHNLEIHVLHDYSHSANLQMEGDAWVT